MFIISLDMTKVSQCFELFAQILRETVHGSQKKEKLKLKRTYSQFVLVSVDVRAWPSTFPLAESQHESGEVF